MKLISMSDFVLNECKNMPERGQIDTLFKIYNYANFLKQPLTLSMFVPCLPSGEPFDKFQLEILNSEDLVPELRAAYKTAQQKVLFKDFKFGIKSEHHYRTIKGEVYDFYHLIKHDLYDFYLNKKTLKTIESLINSDIYLTVAF